MNFNEAIKSVFSKYATFSGRARRSEFWYFSLFHYLVHYSLVLMRSIPFVGTILSIFSLIILFPSLAVKTRRLHDVGKSGWLIVINIALEYLLIFLFIASVGLGSFAKANNSNVDSLFKNMNTNLFIATFICFLVMIVYKLYLLYFYTKDSQSGENKYGPNPKGLDGTNNF